MARPAHHAAGGGFRNPWPDAEPRPLRDLVRWNVERLRHPPPPTPLASAFPVATPAIAHPRGGGDELRATWLGHATTLLQVGGLTVLCDPMWSERASPLAFMGPKRLVPVPLALGDLPAIDVVLLSHNHYDHCDRATVEALSRRQPQARWLAPLGLAPLLRGWGVSQVQERDWWEEERLDTAVGEARFGCTPAQHFSARGLGDRNRTLWCGWTVQVGRWRVFFAGDTALHPDFDSIGRRWGPFDLVMLPVGAYEPRWFMRSVHMNPDEAIAAYDALRAAQPLSPPALMPIHWGTFRLTDEEMREPIARLEAGWRAHGWAPGKLWVMAHGETRVVASNE